MKKYLQKQTGFSLVEMAVTLIVISILFLGGMKGYEVYTNTKLYQLTSEFENLEAMVNSYYITHGRMPAGSSVTITAPTWQSQFWQDLRAEGLVDGDAADGYPPRHAFAKSDTVWLAILTGGATSSYFFMNALMLCATKVNVAHAQGIDITLDDGNSKTGRIRSVKQNSFLKSNGDSKTYLWGYFRKADLINYDDYPNEEQDVAVCQKVARWR